MKRILVPNGNYTDIPLIKAFKDMGLYVITSGNAPELAGHAYADEYVPHDYSDKEGMLELAKQLDIDYISACSNDFGVTTAAYIAQELGLPGHDTYESAKIIAEKDLFKKFALENGILAIPSKGFYSIEEATDYLTQVEYPIIVKPTDLGGGKGVTRVDEEKDAVKAIEYAFSASKAKHIVIEPFIIGTQHSFTTFLVNQKVAVWSSYNEYDSANNSFLVGSTYSPADEYEMVAPILIEQVEKMASLLNLADGIFHMQYKLYKGKPIIIECMRRCLGNYALHASYLTSGIEWEKYISRAYCGLDCSEIKDTKVTNKHIGEYYMQPTSNGIIQDVKIDDELRKYMIEERLQWTKGMEIHNCITQMLGFLFLEFDSPDEGKKIMQECNKYIHYIYE